MNWDGVIGLLLVASALLLLGLAIRQAFRSRQSNAAQTAATMQLLASVTATRGSVAVTMRYAGNPDSEQRLRAEVVGASLEHTRVLLYLDSEMGMQDRFFDCYIVAGLGGYTDEARDGLVRLLKDGTPTALVTDYLQAAKSLPLAFESLRDDVPLEYVEALAET